MTRGLKGALGENTPWYRWRWLRGGGRRVARRWRNSRAKGAASAGLTVKVKPVAKLLWSVMSKQGKATVGVVGGDSRGIDTAWTE